MNSETQLTNSIFWLALVTGAILLIPLIAMQFTREVAWTVSDSIFAGTLIFGTGLIYKIISRRSGKIAYKVAVGLALATGFLLVWANGAVGIIGSESNPINLFYYGLLFIGLVGTAISRLHPKAMAIIMFTTAFLQGLVAAIALIGGFYQSPPSSVTEILSINAFFILLWVGSALSFRYAADENSKNHS